MQFNELGLHADLLRAIAEAGYTTPTPIQEQAIPHVLAGMDVMGAAQTGTGKTAAFTLPILHRLIPLASASASSSSMCRRRSSPPSRAPENPGAP